MSAGLLSFCVTGLGGTTSSVDVSESLATAGLATDAATASSAAVPNGGFFVLLDYQQNYCLVHPHQSLPFPPPLHSPADF